MALSYTNPKTNTNPNPKLTQILTLFSFMFFSSTVLWSNNIKKKDNIFVKEALFQFINSIDRRLWITPRVVYTMTVYN